MASKTSPLPSPPDDRYRLTPTAPPFAQPTAHYSLSSPPPTTIPTLVYRVQHSTAQTRYSFSTGFAAKNQTTILNYTSALSRFGLAHLNQSTNISSPFISVYDNLSHAEKVAWYLAEKWSEELLVVTVDTRHFARGPIFRAADLLKDADGKVDEWMHWGEYLVMYRIPAQAIREQMPIGPCRKQARPSVGVIGSRP
ncbi:hypothetical protein SVAN01_09117 [Stagonosporopsis vannaccii]|nr:hypothetical protein SVAN01_09117 [Stagonosporopsis vannaccii]